MKEIATLDRIISILESNMAPGILITDEKREYICMLHIQAIRTKAACVQAEATKQQTEQFKRIADILSNYTRSNL